MGQLLMQDLSRNTLAVIECIFRLSESGQGADMEEVMELLQKHHGMTEDESERAVEDAEASGAINFGQAGVH
mgnify:CR=1 FL=1